MGYCVYQKDSVFKVLKENKKEALEAIKSLAGKETISDSSGKHFSWVRTKDFLEAKDLEEALKFWGWIPYLDEEDNIVELFFEGGKLDGCRWFLVPFSVQGDV